MSKQISEERFGSRSIWEQLETLAREQIQRFVQRLLEEEVTALMGRAKSERRAAVGEEARPVYRNGHGKPRRLALTSGTIQVRRPRLRGLEERFDSQVLPLFKRRTEQVGELLPQLYLHGLAQGDFELALRALLGDGAPLSASSIERLRGKWTAEYRAWRQRSLVGLEPVYLWADGIYVKAGLEKDKAALLVVIAALRDGRKVILAIEPGHRESAASWAALLRGLRERELKVPCRWWPMDTSASGPPWPTSGSRSPSSAAGTTRSATSSTGCPGACRPKRESCCARSPTLTPAPRPSGAATSSASVSAQTIPPPPTRWCATGSGW
jgi:transposase-like protein